MVRQQIKNRWLAGVAIAALLGAAAVWIIVKLASGGADVADKISSVVGALVALISLALTLFPRLFAPRPGWSSARDSREVLAEQLADRVRVLSEQEEEHRRINDPRPLTVRWHTAADDLFDHWDNIHESGPRSLIGQFSGIRETYDSVGSGRLVILGRAGAGKTALAHHLIVALLADQARTGPVPVLFSLSDWNPTAMGLREWMVHQLIRNYPFLDDRDPGGNRGADLLVGAGRILPVLDGFDEIPARYRRDAISEISRVDGPLVVTSRPEGYTQATRAAKALGRAAAIELDDLTLHEAEHYLRASTSKTRTTEWETVFHRLRVAPEAPGSDRLIQVLTTPLMVTLARTTYNDSPDHSPGELLDTRRFPTREDLEEHLLSSYLSALYDHRHDGTPHDTGRPERNPGRAQHWLGYLATHLTRCNTHDLHWWQLPSTLHRETRILLIMAVSGLGSGLVLGTILFAAMLVNGPADGLILGLTVGVPVGTAVGLINELGFIRRRSGHEPERVRLGLHHSGTNRSLPAYLRKTTSELVSGLALGFAVGLPLTMANSLASGSVDALSPGLANGLLLGLPLGLANMVVSALGENHSLSEAIQPWQLLTTDRTVTLIRSIAALLTVMAAYWLTAFLRDSPDTLVGGLSVGFIGGTVRLTLSAWGNWLLFVRLWLPLTGRLPWRPKRFLENAYQRGVLRQTGAVYQFRHARLRDHLAQRYRNGGNTQGTPEVQVVAATSPAGSR